MFARLLLASITSAARWVALLAVGCAGSSPGTDPGAEGAPCYDNGTCDDGLQCTSDDRCESAPTSSACTGVDCGGHGVCQLASGQAVCLCEVGYHAAGLTCVADAPTDPCLGVTCSGHGTCVAVGSQPTCACNSGYHDVGTTCVADTPTAGSAALTWEAPTTNSDGTTLTDLAGYTVYYALTGTAFATSDDLGMPSCVVVGGVLECTHTVGGLSAGTWSFTVVAYDTGGNYSGHSNQVTKVIP